MKMPRSSTYDARYRGGASGLSGDNRMRGSREMAHTVGCYLLALQCPIRRIAGPCDGADCTDSCSCMPKPPCPKPEKCEDLLENVAAAETDLAQCLDAEGEKFSKIIESADGFDALLEANRAVIRALDDVILKEHALYRELKRIVEICGACEPKPKDARIPEKPDPNVAGIPGKPDPKAFPGYGF